MYHHVSRKHLFGPCSCELWEKFMDHFHLTLLKSKKKCLGAFVEDTFGLMVGFQCKSKSSAVKEGKEMLNVILLNSVLMQDMLKF